MPRPEPLELAFLPGAQELLAVHARELPQRDDLCGAFCGALALQAAGIVEHVRQPDGREPDGRQPDGREPDGREPEGTQPDGRQPVDQDEVALAAGSVISAAREAGALPQGERGRRDYRVRLALIDDADASGTTAAGVVSAIERLSGGALAAIPFTGPWSADTLAGLFDAAVALERPVTLIGNLATHHLWGGRASALQLLGYLLGGELDGPAPDWHVGHFACVVGRAGGPGGNLYALADTYPALGHGGVHWQPQERLAAALERRDMPAGGVIVVVSSEDVTRVRTRAREAGLEEGLWDNGTVEHEPLL
jgi:hypothetical protein